MLTRLLFLAFFFWSCSVPRKINSEYSEQHRPQVHFTPRAAWMNDPNGLVYFNGTYHLFYQHYPNSTVWGPMHWGHAISENLIEWEHKPIALYPDSLGYIFSGSAVIDFNNSSGFGENGRPPMVAIFTHHDLKGEKAGRIDFQYQSLAYSRDEGKTWTKYSGNPVLKNPGIKDFRDPKVIWYAEQQKWVMTLATLDKISFYSSPDLKSWTKESDFGKDIGAHGGVWECPDLIQFDHEGKKIWVLIVSINPGGPNQGSATQYFTGEFDGHEFKPYQTDTRWIDYGPDNYAGVTWFNTGDRKIFIGWMSNWMYANTVPTRLWRSATTIPRDLGLHKEGGKYYVTSMPVREIEKITGKERLFSNVQAASFNITKKVGELSGGAVLRVNTDELKDFTVTLSNSENEKVIMGFDRNNNQYFLDRTHAGKADFDKGFAAKHTAPRLTVNKSMDLTLLIDNSSIELFADNGLTVMTQVFFPSLPFTDVHIHSIDSLVFKSIRYQRLQSIWK